MDERVLRFTFEGGDKGDPISGRGYCLVNGGQMAGRMFRHCGDELGFKAKRFPVKVGFAISSLIRGNQRNQWPTLFELRFTLGEAHQKAQPRSASSLSRVEDSIHLPHPLPCLAMLLSSAASAR